MFEESYGILPASKDLAKPTREHAGLFSSSLAPTGLKGRGVFTLP